MWRIWRWYMKLGKWASDIIDYEERLKSAVGNQVDMSLTPKEAASILEAGQPVFNRARKTLAQLG